MIACCGPARCARIARSRSVQGAASRPYPCDACVAPAAASSGDRFPYIVPAMRGKRSPESARWGSPSLRRSSVRQAPAPPDGRCPRMASLRLITPMVNKSGSPVPPPVAEHSMSLPVSVARKRRGRGRPSAEDAEDVRKKLLDAARDLFPRYGYRGVSSRQIGAAAGVNFAMIRYYFGGKPGLYREMLQGVLQPARVTFDAITAPQSAPQLTKV